MTVRRKVKCLIISVNEWCIIVFFGVDGFAQIFGIVEAEQPIVEHLHAAVPNVFSADIRLAIRHKKQFIASGR